MDKITFYKIIDDTVAKLKTVAITNPTRITSCKSGDDFELFVAEIVKQVISELGYEAHVHHTPGSHVFPDIIIEFANRAKYGIEVKSSSAKKAKGWKINGNSVLGSTRDDDVIETYIIFGKTDKSVLQFKARSYEESVADVVVTHSPRYLIDMDLPNDATFFHESGLDYNTITTSDDPIHLITNHFQSQGKQAWWLPESTPAPPFAIRMFGDMPKRKKYEIFGYSFAHFPELFGPSTTKYSRLAFWLVIEQSLVTTSLRDEFSAGGRVNLHLNGNTYKKLPQIFKKLYECKKYLLEALDQADPGQLKRDWDAGIKPDSSLHSKVKSWIQIVSTEVRESQIPDGVRPIDLLSDFFPEYK